MFLKRFALTTVSAVVLSFPIDPAVAAPPLEISPTGGVVSCGNGYVLLTVLNAQNVSSDKIAGGPFKIQLTTQIVGGSQPAAVPLGTIPANGSEQLRIPITGYPATMSSPRGTFTAQLLGPTGGFIATTVATSYIGCPSPQPYAAPTPTPSPQPYAAPTPTPTPTLTATPTATPKSLPTRYSESAVLRAADSRLNAGRLAPVSQISILSTGAKLRYCPGSQPSLFVNVANLAAVPTYQLPGGLFVVQISTPFAGGGTAQAPLNIPAHQIQSVPITLPGRGAAQGAIVVQVYTATSTPGPSGLTQNQYLTPIGSPVTLGTIANYACPQASPQASP